MTNDVLVGKELPNFTLKTTKRDKLNNTDLIGSKKIIFIYPKNDTSSCTKENIIFSENFKEFERLNEYINSFYGILKSDTEFKNKILSKCRG